MSDTAHPSPLAHSVRSHRALTIAALLALAATAAVVLALVLGGDSPQNTDSAAGVQAQSTLRPDAGPQESSVAAAVGAPPSVSPDESHIAASVSGTPAQPSIGPDESSTAAAVSGR